MTINDLAVMMAKGFSGMEERLTSQISEVKTDVSSLNTDVSSLKIDVAQIKTDLQSFKEETRTSFEEVKKDIKENEASVVAIVRDYHPHIIALEEKVFGHSTLAEA